MIFHRHAVISGEPRAGRSDLVEALRRVLDPRSTHGPVDPLDIHRNGDDLADELTLTEVEVTLLDLGVELEDLLWEHLTTFNPDTGETASSGDMQTAVRGVALCYRASYDLETDTGMHWVDFPLFSAPDIGDFARVRRDLRDAIPVLFLKAGTPLQIRSDGTLRRLVSDSDPLGLAEALTVLDSDVRAATQMFSRSSAIAGGIESVLACGVRDLLGVINENSVELVPEDGTLAGLLRTLEPVLTLDSAGALPVRSHGSTVQSIVTTAEAVATTAAQGGSCVVVADDFGDRLDTAAAQYLAHRLQTTADQVIITTRRPDVVRAFAPEELIRLTRRDGRRRTHRLDHTPDKKERLRRRLILDQFMAAITYRTIVLMEGPTDVEGFGAVAHRMAKEGNNSHGNLEARSTRLVSPPGSDGGITRLPGFAQLALTLGFRVRVVIDNDKAGLEENIDKLPANVEQVVILPPKTAVEAALIRGLPFEVLEDATTALVDAGEIDAIPESVDDLTKYLIKSKTLKNSAVHVAWAHLVSEIPPIARQLIEILCQPATQQRLDLPDIEHAP
ncbi:hypothetical protein [Mycobacteroides sp. CBMA 271]|uniref:hypothetical protein n=1 Tax=Mycobacteroides sp. CBMA 271 TaxID=2606608 RepID=UPI001411BA1A|nr:hypothetical protein [Mycobacteroides sp. CBMA 271]